MPRRLITTLVAGAALALPVASAHATPRLYECQHPMTTGQEAYDLHHVTPRRACAEVRRLARFAGSLHTPAQSHAFYTCRNHRPVLHRHSLDGWRLSLRHGEFTMSRGRASFAVTGTDFPVPCI